MDGATAIAVEFAVVALLSAFVLPSVAHVTCGQSLILAAAPAAIGCPLGDLRALARRGGCAGRPGDRDPDRPVRHAPHDGDGSGMEGGRWRGPA